MANYATIFRLKPEAKEFAQRGRYTEHGDVLAYARKMSGDGFSTDDHGFRHSAFKGETLSFTDCAQRDRYGLVLGASNIHGFGIAGNENTLPSLLGELVGFPFVNATMPGGNSRNLHSLLVGLVAMAPKPPAIVVHYNGGDLSTFCYSSNVHPIFGSPNRQQVKMRLKQGELRVNATPEAQAEALQSFSSLWTSTVARFCKAQKIRLALGHTGTFFDKATPSAYEKEAQLGTARDAAQEQQFANHRAFNAGFYARREVLAKQLGLPLAGVTASRSIGYIDEFHPDADGHKALATDLAKVIEPLLSKAK